MFIQLCPPVTIFAQFIKKFSSYMETYDLLPYSQEPDTLLNLESDESSEANLILLFC